MSYISVISASVPTKEFLSEFNEIKFPNQSKPVINDLENQAQMIIPSVIISKQGTCCINSVHLLHIHVYIYVEVLYV